MCIMYDRSAVFYSNKNCWLQFGTLENDYIRKLVRLRIDGSNIRIECFFYCKFWETTALSRLVHCSYNFMIFEKTFESKLGQGRIMSTYWKSWNNQWLQKKQNCWGSISTSVAMGFLNSINKHKWMDLDLLKLKKVGEISESLEYFSSLVVQYVTKSNWCMIKGEIAECWEPNWKYNCFDHAGSARF